MSQPETAPQLPEVTVDLSELITLRDTYLSSVRALDEEMANLSRTRRATAGAVDALTRFIDSKRK